LVDLLPQILPNVVDVDLRRGALHGKGVRVAEAEDVDELVDPGGDPHERVVARDEVPYGGVVPSGHAAVELGHVDANQLAQEAGQRLRDTVSGAPGAECLQVVSGGSIELAIGTEVNGTAVVVAGGERVEVEDGSLVREGRSLGIGVVDGEAAQ